MELPGPGDEGKYQSPPKEGVFKKKEAQGNLKTLWNMQIKNSIKEKKKPGPGYYNLEQKQTYKGTFDKDDRVFEKMTQEHYKAKMKEEKQ